MKEWIIDMLVRAFKTLVQALVASLVAVNAVDEINWYLVIVTSAGAFAMSIIMSLCSHFGIEVDE